MRYELYEGLHRPERTEAAILMSYSSQKKRKNPESQKRKKLVVKQGSDRWLYNISGKMVVSSTKAIKN